MTKICGQPLASGQRGTRSHRTLVTARARSPILPQRSLPGRPRSWLTLTVTLCATLSPGTCEPGLDS